MRIDQMRNFIVISQHRSINKAAESLFISQQALNASINSMEKELGVSLLKRTNHGIQLTSDGEMVYNTFQQIIEIYDSMHDNLFQKMLTSSHQNLSLKICITPYLLEHNLTNYVQRFSKDYFDVSYSVESYHDVLNAQIDLAKYDLIFANFYYKNGAFIDPYNQTIYTRFNPIYKNEFFIVCHESSKFSNLKNFTLPLLQKLPLHTYNPQTTNNLSKKQFESLLQMLGLKQNMHFEDSLYFCFTKLENNDIYLFCASAFTSLFNRPYLKIIPISLPIQIYLGYFEVKDKPFSLSTMNFINYLSKQYNKINNFSIN